VDPNRRTQDLSDDDVNRLRKAIETSFKVEGALRTEVSMNIKRLMDIGCYGTAAPPRPPDPWAADAHERRTKKGPRRAIAGKKRAPKK